MNSKLAIWAYDNRSLSARTLAQELDCRLIRHKNSKFRPAADKLIINWGGSYHAADDLFPCPVLNSIGSRNKIETFQTLDGKARIPEWATRRENGPIQWLNEGSDVVVRHVIRGHGGKGIRIVKPGEQLDMAPLYTRYVKKKREFRVHCFERGGAISAHVHEKKGRRGVEKNYQIRNHDNGFVYIRDVEDAPEDVVRQAYQAFVALGLDFGAVDVIYNEHEDKAYVLECNTAPGMDGITIDLYVEYFKEAYNALLHL